MKVFKTRELKEAIQHAMEGGQALHLHRIVFEDSPSCFRSAVANGEDIAHLFDQDVERLIRTARSLGVRVIYVDGKDERQHIDLCGGPLRKALAISSRQIEEGK